MVSEYQDYEKANISIFTGYRDNIRIRRNIVNESIDHKKQRVMKKKQENDDLIRATAIINSNRRHTYRQVKSYVQAKVDEVNER